MAKFHVPIRNLEFQLFELEQKSFKRRNSVSTVLVAVTLAGHTGDCVRRRRSTRRPSTILAHRAARAYPVAVPFLVSPPSILILELVRPESSRVAAVRRVGHGSPPHLDSSHPELRSLAVHPLRPPTSAAVPYPGRIGLAPSSDRRSPSPLVAELRPLCRAPSPGHPPPQIDPW